MKKRLKALQEQLQGKKSHMKHFLTGIHLQGIRGIDDIRVAFDYPVSVLAGGNASGKSTVLFAAACAYNVPTAKRRAFVPSTLFPYYRPRIGRLQDVDPKITIDFDYQEQGGSYAMRWRRTKSWNPSFFGRKGGRQPERQVYLRTLSNLTSPSEVRGVLSLSRLQSEPNETPLTAYQIEFAQRILPFSYSKVVDLSLEKKNLLFASQKSGAGYSELHMASGERAILRLAKEIAQLDGALVLIDEVEAGLHPWVQQVLMLQLQQLALRNSLQIIVTTHSPVVLDSVPMNGRIFLDRDEAGRVTVLPPYRDIVQNALYGRSSDVLNLLCEDDVAEHILQGIFDAFSSWDKFNRESVRIGRDTGAGEFPNHADAFRKFGQIQNFIFILDGDQRDKDIEQKIQDKAGNAVRALFLPGNNAPEIWIWNLLSQYPEHYSEALGTEKSRLLELIHKQDSIYDSAADSAQEIAKYKLNDLSTALSRDATEVCRIVARKETNRPESDIQPLVNDLKNALQQWRTESEG